MRKEKSLLKFNLDKTYRYFAGVTIIKHIDDQSLNQLIIEIKNHMQHSNLFDKFVFLPEDSYHMTVADLLTFQDLQTNEAFEDFPLKNEADIHAIDQYILQKLACESFDLFVKMRVVKINHKQIRLAPKTDEDAQKLLSFRKEVYQKLNIKMHSDYHFHISLNYQLLELTSAEKVLMDAYLDELNKVYVDQFQDVDVDVAVLTAFNDMSTFRQLSLKRAYLGLYKR